MTWPHNWEEKGQVKNKWSWSSIPSAQRTQQASFNKPRLWILSLVESLPQMTFHCMIAQLGTKWLNYTILLQDTSGLWFLRTCQPDFKEYSPVSIQSPDNWMIVSRIRNQGTRNRLHNSSDNGIPSSCPNPRIIVYHWRHLGVKTSWQIRFHSFPNLAIRGPRGCQLSSQKRVLFLLPIVCLTHGWIKLLMPKIFLTVQEVRTGTFIDNRHWSLITYSFIHFIQSSASFLCYGTEMFRHSWLVPISQPSKPKLFFFLWDTNKAPSNFGTCDLSKNRT